MARGGSRKGAGRKPGAATKRARESADMLAVEGLMPLDYLVGVMRETMPFDPNRFEAAKHAAPYMHPKLAAVEHTGRDGGPVESLNEIVFRIVDPRGKR